MIASLTFTSCEDFLTEEVRGQQNLDTYFQSAEEAEAFITGCYQAKVKVTIFLWPTIKVPDKAMVPSPTFGSIDTKAFYVAISQWNAFHKLISQMKK